MPSKRRKSQRVIFFLSCLGYHPSAQRRGIDYAEYLTAAALEPQWMGHSPLYAYERWSTDELGGPNQILRWARRLIHYGWGALIVAGRFWSLLRLLMLAPRARGVFIQRVTPPAWYTRVLRLLNPNIAFDFDDAVFLQKPKATETLVRSSRVVSAGSHFNLEYAQLWNSHCVFLPTPVPAHRFEPVCGPRPSNPVVIGWIGSITTLPYLQPVVPVLNRVGKKYPNVMLRVIGCGNRSERVPHFSDLSCDVVRWIPYSEVPAAVCQFDIGIMPLPRNDWAKGKCVLKALEYMAAGVPPVASRFGENVYGISDGVDGFLADSEDEWVEKLSMLIEDAELRSRMGMAARRTIEARYSTAVCSRILIEQVLGPLCA